MDFESLVERIYETLPDKVQEPVRILVNGTITLAPVLGQYYHQYQHRKINRALENESSKLESIAIKIENSEEQELFKEEIFPIIVSKILNEPQEEKIKIIIDGFEHFIDKEITDLDMIFVYYDVLEDLRLSDIAILSKDYFLRESTTTEVRRHYKSPEDFLDREPFAMYMINKLQMLGLLQENKHGTISSTTGKVFELTPFGEKFCEFFLRNES